MTGLSWRILSTARTAQYGRPIFISARREAEFALVFPGKGLFEDAREKRNGTDGLRNE